MHEKQTGVWEMNIDDVCIQEFIGNEMKYPALSMTIFYYKKLILTKFPRYFNVNMFYLGYLYTGEIRNFMIVKYAHDFLNLCEL